LPSAVVKNRALRRKKDFGLRAVIDKVEVQKVKDQSRQGDNVVKEEECM
jgi:hypothetical protein